MTEQFKQEIRDKIEELRNMDLGKNNITEKERDIAVDRLKKMGFGALYSNSNPKWEVQDRISQEQANKRVPNTERWEALRHVAVLEDLTKLTGNLK